MQKVREIISQKVTDGEERAYYDCSTLSSICRRLVDSQPHIAVNICIQHKYNLTVGLGFKKTSSSSRYYSCRVLTRGDIRYADSTRSSINNSKGEKFER